MLRALMVILFLALPFMALGQDVVKINILEIAGKIPPPPADVKDAYARTSVPKEDGTEGSRNADAYFKPVSDRLDAANQQIGKGIEYLSKPQLDAAKEMNSEEMQKKFKSMSQEERIKYAMEMSKKMGLGAHAMVRESDPVMAAQAECMKITQEYSTDIQNASAQYQSREKLESDREAKHREIDQWKVQEENKLPQVNYGEMSGPEPKAEYALLTKVMEKHFAVERDYLKGIQKEWKAAWDKYQARFTPFEGKLETIHYGEDAKNPETRRQLLNGQSLMLSSTSDLVGLSRKATESAAQWWQRKLDLEKNKPQK
jgi:hypothetical protein